MFCIASISIALPSCEKLYEDLDPCPHGVSLRFIYDYNMEWANAFPKQVDCLTLYIYDEDGDYVGTKVVTGSELQDESYRMTLDLEKGVYRFVAYGGMACEKASFSWAGIPSQGSRYTDLVTKMDISQVNSPIAEQRRLHDMFWGELTLATADLYSEGTVEMMKNTNNLRIVLQQENGKPVDVNDFDFAITDNNSVFGHDNDLITENVSPVTYRPWSTGPSTDRRVNRR